MKVRKHQSGRGSTSLEPVYKHASILFLQNLGCTTGGVHISGSFVPELDNMLRLTLRI